MQEADLYFTHTIVGGPLTVPLGSPLRNSAQFALALDVDPLTGRAQLHPTWREWLAARVGDTAAVGRPWRRPGALRRFYARHNLLVGFLLGCALSSGALALTVLLVPSMQPTDAAQWLVHFNDLLYRLTH
jgi:hypothetical protein